MSPVLLQEETGVNLQWLVVKLDNIVPTCGKGNFLSDSYMESESNPIHNGERQPYYHTMPVAPVAIAKRTPNQSHFRNKFSVEVQQTVNWTSMKL